MILKLLGKEFLEHRWVAVGIFLLSGVEYFAFLEFWLRHEPPTALVAAINFTWATAPLIAAYTARRLFVLEQERKTIELLRSLPVSSMLVTATKFTLGLAYNLAVNLVVLVGSAWILQNQEIITVEWIGRLSIQVSAYVFAWFALASFHAQLGGYRYAGWLVSMVALTSLDEVVTDPSRNLFWTAPLADELEMTRYATPWDAVGLGLVWGGVATAATLSVAQYRGGTLVDTWFGPMSGRRRAEVTSVVIIVLLAFSVASNIGGRHPSLLPWAEDATVHTSDGKLNELRDQIETALAGLRSKYEIGPLPKVLLRIRRDDRPEPVLTDILNTSWPGEVVVGVRSDAPADERLRLILTDVLSGQSAGHWERVPAVGVWALGFAPFVLDDRSLGRTAARLTEHGEAALSSYDAIRQGFGRRGAEAAGWLAWRAVEEIGGPTAVKRLARALFAERRSLTGAGLIAAQQMRPLDTLAAAGVDHDRLLKAWRTAAETHRRAESPPVEWSMPPIRLERPPDQLPRLAWRDLLVDPATHRVQLWWSVALDLDPYPVPQDELRVTDIQDRSGAYIILLDPRLRIVATWVVDGEVQGWTEVAR